MKLRDFSVFGRSLAIVVGASLIAVTPVLASPSGEKAARPGHHCAAMGRMMSRVSVKGVGESRVAPDLALIDLGVSTQAETAAEASARNAEAQTSVIDALKQAGLDEADIQTSQFDLGPVMQYSDNEPPKITGYRASNMVTVRVADLERTGQILDAIVAAGSNEIHGIRFSRENSDGAGDEALAAAVEDARRKAGVMARAAGMQLGPVLSMSDTVQRDQPQLAMMRAEAVSLESTPVQPGELSVSAHVQVSFALTKKGQRDDCGGSPMQGHGMKDKQRGDIGQEEQPEEGAKPNKGANTAPSAPEPEGKQQ